MKTWRIVLVLLDLQIILLKSGSVNMVTCFFVDLGSNTYALLIWSSTILVFNCEGDRPFSHTSQGYPQVSWKIQCMSLVVLFLCSYKSTKLHIAALYAIACPRYHQMKYQHSWIISNKGKKSLQISWQNILQSSLNFYVNSLYLRNKVFARYPRSFRKHHNLYPLSDL